MRRAVVAFCAFLLSTACSEPPQKEIDRAQGAIDAARAAGAEQYAPEPFGAATTAMRQTHEAVQQGDYRLALSRAIDANERAIEAARQAADGKARARGEADAAVAHLTAAVRQLEDRLKVAEAARLPARDIQAAEKTRAEAARILQEARAAVARGDYLTAATAASALPAKITAEIQRLNEITESRAARAPRKRR